MTTYNQLTTENVNFIIQDCKKFDMRNVEFDDFYNYFTADYTDEEIEIAYKRLKLGYNEIKTNKNNNTFYFNGTNYSVESLKSHRGSSLAKKICESHYIRISNNYNYVSTNADGLTFWINPDASRLTEDWSIIINNIDERKLYVFFIPANTFNVTNFKTRKNPQLQLDIQIDISSKNFEDRRSKIRFAPYKVTELTY